MSNNPDCDSDEGSKSVMLFCEFNYEIHVMTVNEGTKLIDIYNSLAKKWEGITSASTKLQYEAPIERMPVTLCSDEDVVEMCRVNILLKTAICKVVVTSHNSVNKRKRYVITSH